VSFEGLNNVWLGQIAILSPVRGPPLPAGFLRLLGLYGGPGNDVLNGGTGTDSADGGPNFDTCNAETETNCET
jgi:hypothetical protein